MPIINSYPQDIDIQDQDAWIGTDYTTKGTKQYTAEAVANYLNQKGKVSIAGQVSYKFVDTLFAGQGTMALSPNNGSSFSAITGFKIAKADLSGQGIQEYLDYLVGREIIIVDQSDPNSFGHYSIYTYTVDDDNDQYYDLVVTFLGGNGSISVNSFYSLANFTFGGENATKATLTNIGIGNVNPSTYPTLKGLTVSYNNGTATIGLNIQDLPNTTIPTSASDILVPWATEVSGVTYNSKATLQDLIDDTGIVGGPYLPLTGGTLTGDLHVNTKVGIGTASPDSLLEISTTDATKDFIKLTSSGGGVNPSLIFEKSTAEQGVVQYIRNGDLKIYNTDNDGGVMLSGSGATNYDVYINNSGNVGIGTTSPQGKLDISTASSSDIFNLRIHNLAGETSQSTGILFNTGYTDINRGKGGLVYEYDTSAGWNRGDFHFLQRQDVNSGIARLSDSVVTIKNNGNVGIGTTAPSYPFVAKRTGSNVVASFESDQNAYLRIARTGTQSGEAQLRVTNNGNISITSDGNIGLKTGGVSGTNRLYVRNSDGNVGIGTTGPSEKLEVAGNVKVDKGSVPGKTAYLSDDGLYIGRLSASGGGYPNNIIVDPSSPNHLDINSRSRINLKLNTNTVLVASDSGNVGIGTTTPSEKLEVVGNVKASYGTSYASITPSNMVGSLSTKSQSVQGAIVSSVSSGNTFASQDVYTGVNIGSFNGAGTVTIGAFYYGNVNYQTGHNGYTHSWYGSRSNNPWLTLNATGLGIGATSPNAKLEVAGDLNIGSALPTVGALSNKLNFWGYTAGQGVCASIGSYRGNNYVSGGLIFETGELVTSEKMRITPNGNVGIGTTSPSSKLEVNGDIDTTGSNGYLINGMAWALENSGVLTLGDWDGNDFPTRIMDNNSSEVLRVTDGNVGIGTTNPAAKLDIESTTSGVLLPRMTTAQVNAISSPSNGLTVYNTTLNTLCFYNGSSWWKVSAQTM